MCKLVREWIVKKREREREKRNRMKNVRVC